MLNRFVLNRSSTVPEIGTLGNAGLGARWPPQQSNFLTKNSNSYPHIVILFPEIYVKNYLIIQQHIVGVWYENFLEKCGWWREYISQEGREKDKFLENSILLSSRQNYIILMDFDVFWINMITVSWQNDQPKINQT